MATRAGATPFEQIVGQEFDNVMYPILTTNYGDPLQFDASLDNNQRFYMVSTKRVNDTEGIAGYVLSTDFYPRSVCGTRCSGDSCTGQPWMA